jgi:ribonuclease H / adenosylcobalamin/alpha-ribazole phosphatase
VPRWFPDNEPPTRLLLVRHGSTEHSHDGRFSGRNDLPLDETGRAQAQAIARHVSRMGPVDIVLSSPLRRACETAAAIVGRVGGRVEVVDDLVEMEFGEWEGLTLADAHLKWPDVITDWLAGVDIAPPGGESFGEVEARVIPAVQRIVDRYRGLRIVAVSHVTPIKTLLRIALSAPQQTMFKFHLDTASLSVIDYFEDGTSSVRTINNSEHPG